MTRRRWKSADDLEYNPKALRELTAGLRALHEAAYPSLPSSPAAVGRSGAVDSATPDPARAELRKELHNILETLTRQARKAHALARRGVVDPRIAKLKAWTCPACSTGNRPQALVCSACGLRRSTEQSQRDSA